MRSSASSFVLAAALSAAGCFTGGAYSPTTAPTRSESAYQLSGGNFALAEALERAADEYTCPVPSVTAVSLHDWGNGNETFAVHACGHDAVYTCMSLEGSHVCLHDTWGPAPATAAAP